MCDVTRRTSANVMKPLWAADELGLDCEQTDVGGKFGGSREPDHLAMHPMGLVTCGRIIGRSMVSS